MSAEQLLTPIEFFGVFNLPAVLYLGFLNNHSIHHRGELATYLRPMGSKAVSYTHLDVYKRQRPLRSPPFARSTKSRWAKAPWARSQRRCRKSSTRLCAARRTTGITGSRPSRPEARCAANSPSAYNQRVRWERSRGPGRIRPGKLVRVRRHLNSGARHASLFRPCKPETKHLT